MAPDWTFFPEAMTQDDLQVMQGAVRYAANLVDNANEEQLASIVFRFYRRGLVDPERLAQAAVYFSTSHATAHNKQRPT
jgi:hypothetical protein